MLIAENVSWAAGGRRILEPTSLVVEEGETLGLVGPNGAGKSTLLRIMAGVRACEQGRVLLAGKDVHRLSRRAAARDLALVEQFAETSESLTVKDVVALGRTPYLGLFHPWSEEDGRAVDEALAIVDMSRLAGRQWQSLSGGERQRAQVARALAQKPAVLLLDEPTNHLDIRHQLDLLGLVRQLPLTSVIVLHDLNLAAMFCDRVAVMNKGRIAALGPVDKVLSRQCVEDVFGVRASLRPRRDAAGWCLELDAASPKTQQQPGGKPDRLAG